LKIKWFTETDVSVAEDEDLLDLLRPSGCHQLLIGFESVLRENLSGMDKHHWKAKKYDSYLSAIQKVQSHGVSVDGCFILGLDADTLDVFEQTRDFIEASQLLEAQITVSTPFPGSRLYNRLKNEGRLIKDIFWDRCTLFDINFVPKRMSVKQLEDGIIWLGSQIYNQEALERRKDHYKAIVRNLT